MIHTGFIGAGGANYEWYEHCTPPDPKMNQKGTKAVYQAMVANWQACNEAAVKYNAGLSADDPTPEWVVTKAAEKGAADVKEIEEKTQMSYTPALDILAAEAFAAAAQDDQEETDKQKKLQIMILGGTAVVLLGVVLFATRG